MEGRTRRISRTGGGVALRALLAFVLAIGLMPAVPSVAFANEQEEAPDVQPSEGAIATVNGKGCDSIQSVVETAKSEAQAGAEVAIVLLQDVEGTTDAGFEIPVGMTVTLNLNGNDLIGKNAGSLIVNNGTLNIFDSEYNMSGGQDGGHVYTTDTEGQGRHAIENYGTLAINGGFFGDKNSDEKDANDVQRGNAVRNYGIATIERGSFTCCDNYTGEGNGFAYAIANGSASHPDASMTINNATVYGSVNGLIASDGGTLAVKEGSYVLGDGTEDNLWRVGYTSGSGVIEISGGSFEKNTIGTDRGFFGGTQGGFVISGGTFESKTTAGIYIDMGSVLISGGTFKNAISTGTGASALAVGGVFESGLGTAAIPSGMKFDESSKQVVIDESKAVAGIGQAAYSSLFDAVNAADAGDTITLLKSFSVESPVTINKAVTVTAADGVVVYAAEGAYTFVIQNGATIDGVTFELNCANDVGYPSSDVVGMHSGTTVKNCSFTGNYENGRNFVSRGVVPTAGATNITITDNTFTDLRQPGYIEAASGTISNNHTTGTRGWVVCCNSGAELTGNTFGENIIDIAITPNNGADNKFTGKADDLSKANAGAYVQNQVNDVEAKDGNLVVGSGTAEYTLGSALADAQNGDTIKLEADIETGRFTIPDGVTVDGNGHTIKDVSTGDPGTFVLMGNNSTLENAILNIDGKDKHGVQFYCTKDGALNRVTVNGGTYTSVIVNGATDVTIEDCVLNPDGYANIEYAMGTNVTTVPTLTVENVDFADDAYQIWADERTTGKIATDIGGNPTQQQIRQKIISNITNLNEDPITLTTRFESATSTPVSDTIESEVDQPSTPVTPSKPSFDVAIEQPANGTITVSPESAKEGQKVTVTVTPDAGFELASLVVADEDGDALELTENADGTYSFEMPAGDVTVHAAFECDGGELCPSHGFTDVDQEQWYHAAIDWAVDNDVLQGVGDGLMLPDGDITRAQMAQVLWNVEGQPAAAEGERFSDVSEGDWFAGAVAWASQEGIFVGYDGAFDPDAELTREQAATVLMRWAESNGEDVSGRADLSGFPDADGISEWAVESVRWAVDAGVLEGVANPDGTTTVSAQGTATRAQTAALMMRLLEA